MATAAAGAGRMLLLPMCGDPAHIVRVPVKDRRPAPANDCPAGCHALCTRRSADDDGDAAA
ncbi:hypothetical protein [Sphingomonas sp.]|uniref:hypothetical protein n=1 Tax=Sphingomonas sp. TaxID=28214 RepID=UPI001DEA1CDD|nr:hypothetical protein [Sphingomonas sp.]MBX9796708.1 hypothetical protein [Sphingomonas sp.]